MNRLHPDDLAEIRRIIQQELFDITNMLSRLLVPVAEQRGRQRANMTDEERRAENKRILADAKERVRRRAELDKPITPSKK